MKFILILSMLLMCDHLDAQLGSHFFGGTGDDIIYQIKPSDDGGYYLLGAKTIISRDVWLVKIDSSLDVVWEKTYGHTNPERHEIGYNLIFAENGHMYIVGASRDKSGTSDEKGLVFKVDSIGNEVWKKFYNDVYAIYDLVPNGNQLLAGGYDFWSGFLLHLDLEGNVLSTNEIKVSGQTYIKKIQPLQDGNFLLIGLSNNVGSGYSGLFIRKINPSSETLWTRIQDTESREDDFDRVTKLYGAPSAVVIEEDSTIWIASTIEGNNRIGLFSFDINGNILSNRKYSTGNENKFATSLLPLSDGGWLIGGTTDTDSTFALRIGAEGQEKWHQYYWKKDTKDVCFSAAVSDTFFLLGGMVQRSVQNNSDYDGTLFKIENDGNPFPFEIKGLIQFDQNQNCQSDTLEPALTNWFVTVSSIEQSSLLITNPSGEFNYKMDADSIRLFVHNPDTMLWTLCDNNILIETDSLEPVMKYTIHAKPNDSCGKLEVGLTQPEYIKCDTSCLVATVKNRGNLPSDYSLLKLKLDPEFNLISVSTPYVFSNNTVDVLLPPIQIQKTERVEMCVSLDCDVQLGATHSIEARIKPDFCAEPYDGPIFTVRGCCEEDKVRFAMQNIGGGGAQVITTYSVYVNAELLVEQQEIHLSEGGEPIVISLPSDGRTWRVQMNQDNGFSSIDFPSATVEACGQRPNGWHDVGYQNAFRPNDLSNVVSIASTSNTTGGPNKIVEAFQGLGRYNIVTEKNQLEYTARVLNEFDVEVSTVIIDLSFTANWDVKSFHITSAKTEPIIEIINPSTIRIVLEDAQVSVGELAMVRFSISPIDSIMPNDGYNSLLQIKGKVYLNGYGPIELANAFQNFAQFEPEDIEGHSTYPNSIITYGGRNIDFASNMICQDNELFLAGSSNSFGLSNELSGYITKTDASGKIKWYTTIKQKSHGRTNLRGIASDGDHGCLYVGSFNKSSDPDYTNFSYGVIGRLDANGNTLWSFLLRPAGDLYGTIFNGILKTSDDHYLVYGQFVNNGSKRIYMKISRDGEILWTSENNFYKILPETVAILSDGNYLFHGNNKNYSSFTVLQKVDPEGTVLWETFLTSGTQASLGRIVPTEDNGFFWAGNDYWKNGDDYVSTPLIIKCDSLGRKEFEKRPLLGDYLYANVYDFIQAKEGGYLATGEIKTGANFNDVALLILKLDVDADVEWFRSFGNQNREAGFQIANPTDDDIYCWGHHQSTPVFQDLQSILVHTNSQGVITADQHIEAEQTRFETLIFPNPASGFCNVILSPLPEKEITWLITNILGQIILSGKDTAREFIHIETSRLNPGTYFLTFPGTGYLGKQLVIIQ